MSNRRDRVRALRMIYGIAVLLAGAALVGCGSSSSASGPVTLNWYVYPEPSGSFAYAASTCSKDSGGKYNIVMQLLSTSSDQQRVSEVRRLAAGDSSIDILAMDVDWTAEYATAKWIRPWPAALAAQVTRGDLPGPVATASWNGRLYAAPLNSNTEILWYRKDLLAAIHQPPPTTWTQMFHDADLLAKAGKAHFIEEQGSQYEGLTVWFNSLVDSAGGGILTKNDKIVVGPSTRVAASIMHELATSPAADPSLNVTMEAQSETAFEHGTAAFQINYPFVWAAAHKDTPSIGKEMGYALFPRVNPAIAPRVSIGGYNLAVSSFSKHPQLAFDAVKCMIQPQFQRRDAIQGGLAPVQASIYSEPAFIKSYPFAAIIKAQLERYGIRPKTPVYADVTLAIQKALSPTSAIQPKSVVNTLRNEIKSALSSEALL